MNSFRQQLQDTVKQRLTAPYIRSVCCMMLGAFLILQTISFATTDRGPTVFGPYLGADFAVFYVAGTIFNSYHPENIYNVKLHTRLYRGLFPRVPPQGELPYANAPFFVLPFALLAHLSYQSAYLFWMVISCGLYFGGLKLLRGTFDALPDWPTALFLALSFAPFLFEGLAGGQVSVFGFFALALTLNLERRGYNVAAGAALAVLAYKPTLLVLILPMLVITRRRSLLCGFALGIMVLASLSIFAVGWQGCHNYLKMLLLFLHTSTGAASVLRTWKYVDINSFSKMLTGGQVWGRWALVLIAVGAISPFIFRAWTKAKWAPEKEQSLVWAITIAWTLVLNVYLGIYDTILIVASVLIATDLHGRKGLQSGMGYRYLLVLLYLIPLVTQPVAQSTGIQLYTLVLAAFGFYLMSLFGHRLAVEPGTTIDEKGVGNADLSPCASSRHWEVGTWKTGKASREEWNSFCHRIARRFDTYRKQTIIKKLEFAQPTLSADKEPPHEK